MDPKPGVEIFEKRIPSCNCRELNQVVGGIVPSLATIPTELSVLVYYVIGSGLSSVFTRNNIPFVSSLQSEAIR